uniref:Uncharacterized protein n=1 Tax=Helianthus annuus TaxID=4232 RepID=A0A251V3F2_HELAN
MVRSLYAPLPRTSSMMYGPSHLGASFPGFSALDASLRSRSILLSSSLLIRFMESILGDGSPISAGITASDP